MTAQINDKLFFRGSYYDIISTEGCSIFEPPKVGIETGILHTACWRGFYCKYVIDDNEDKLYLDNLTVLSSNGKYPEINGREAKPDETYLDKGDSNLEGYRGPFAYTNLKMEMNDFTGKLTIGNGFIDEYYIHQGFQHSFAYKKVLELEIRNGRLIKMKDYSKRAKEFRRKISANTEPVTPPEWLEIVEYIDENINKGKNLGVSADDIRLIKRSQFANFMEVEKNEKEGPEKKCENLNEIRSCDKGV